MITIGWLQRRNSLEVSNTRSYNPPCIWVEYCSSWDRLKFWIKGSTLGTFSSNIWSRLKSPTIKILCCVGISLINKIKLSMKVPRGPGIRHYYQILLFYFQYTQKNFIFTWYLVSALCQPQVLMVFVHH